MSSTSQALHWVAVPAQFALAYALAWIANRVGLVAWRRSAGAHWTERARQLWPARVTAVSNIIMLPVMLHAAQSLVAPEWADHWLVSGLAALAGALLGNYAFDREVFPAMAPRVWLAHAITGWGLRLSVWVVFTVGLVIMPREFGWNTLWIAGGYLLFHLSLQFGLAFWCLRRGKILVAPGARLVDLVERCAVRTGIRPRRVWAMTGPLALASAYPVTRELVFSDRLAEICSDEEVESVCAHEMAHLGESRATLAGRVLGSLALFPILFLNPALARYSFGAFLLPLLSLGVFLFSRRLSRRMEVRADSSAAASQSAEGVYARALEKIYRENQLPAVNVNSRQTHPHLYDRMQAAGITPDFPRPARPRKMTWIGRLYLVIFFTLLIMTIARG